MLVFNKIKTYKHNVFHYVFVMLAILVLSACASQANTSSIKNNPIKVILLASKNVNPNSNGQSAPINVYLYELKSVDNFKDGNFFTISEGKDTLINNDILKVSDFILLPGESKKLDVKPQEDTIAIGVVAAYREINKAAWNKVYMLPKKVSLAWYEKILPKNKKVLWVSINELAISIKEMD